MITLRSAYERGRFGEPGRSRPEGWAVIRQRTRATRGFAGEGHATFVKDHPMGQHGPVLAWNELTDFTLDLDRVLGRGPTPSAHESPEVCVHGDSRHLEGLPEYDVGGFPTDTGKRYQIVDVSGHGSVEPLDERRSELGQRGRFVPVETCRADHLFQLGTIGACVVDGS